MPPSAHCPSCGKVVEIHDHDAGRTLHCPDCAERYIVLGAEQADPEGNVPVLPFGPEPKSLPRPRGGAPLTGRRRTVRPWIRYWARIIDWVIWRELLWPVVRASGLLPDSYPEPWTAGTTVLVGVGFSCTALLLWIPVEALLLSRWGATPGKWILRVRVSHREERPLSFERAVYRTGLVYAQGMALGIWIADWIAWTFAWFELRREGKTRWDAAGGFEVTHRRIGILRIIAAVAILLGPTFVRTVLPLM